MTFLSCSNLSASAALALGAAGSGWDKRPPPPSLPADVVAATSARYVEGYERITGRDFAAWAGVDQTAAKRMGD